MWKYFWNILVWLSQGLNTIGRGGDPDETLSSAAGKAKHLGHWWGCVLCWFLDKVDRRHCEKSIEPDEGEEWVYGPKDK